MRPIADLVLALERGETTSRALVETCLDRIADPAGEGRRVFLTPDPQGARDAAMQADALRREGRAPSPLTGIPVSIKALFDVAGWVTSAGSAVLHDNPPARTDAEAVRRLRAAGMVLIGHTNMTEFAYSGLGANPHFGTPKNPFDRAHGRIPGGSSSGAAVSVSDGMAAAGLGTDTGGSCRIPAAFCGLAGFKPTARRVPLAGTFPLSASFDSIGPIARTADCCARIDAVLSGDADAPDVPDLAGLRFGILKTVVLDGMEAPVAAAYTAALQVLARAGAVLIDIALPDMVRLPDLNARGGIVGAEAYRHHAERLVQDGARYDPRVRMRIEKAREQAPGEYEALLATRSEMIARAAALTAGFDAVVMPTTPIQAPLLSDLAEDADYGRLNLLALRNPTIANFLDRCAISLPMPTGNGLPAGLMLMGETMADRRLLSVAKAVETVLRSG